jgi:hypothetical protein
MKIERKYKFQRKLKIYSKDDIKRASKLAFSPDIIDYRNIIEDFIYILRKRYGS